MNNISVRALLCPMHLGLKIGPLCPIARIMLHIFFTCLKIKQGRGKKDKWNLIRSYKRSECLPDWGTAGQ
jgi:hypothetical protein